MDQTYAFRARNQQNAVVTGTVQAVSIEAAKKALSQNSLTPLAITVPRGFRDFLPFGKKVSLKDRTLFARQLATMIQAGLTLSQSLRLLIQQSKRGKFRQVQEALLNDLQDGFGFSTALAKFPDVFDSIFINVVRSGEATGKLEVVLDQISTTMEKDVKVKAKLKGALFYPAFILFAMLVVGYIMMTRVVPQLKDVFEQASMELPQQTKVLIWLSDFMVQRWYVLILIVIVIPLCIRAYLRTEQGTFLFSKLILKIPVANIILEQSTMARLSRLLALLLGSGVPLLEALRLVNDSFTNRLYRQGITEVARQVERGVPMSVPITQNPVFPVMVGQMVAVGEQTGKMDEVMIRLADYYDGEVDAKVAGLSALIEPFVIVVLGIGVAFLVIAILMPIYQISTAM